MKKKPPGRRRLRKSPSTIVAYRKVFFCSKIWENVSLQSGVAKVVLQNSRRLVTQERQKLKQAGCFDGKIFSPGGEERKQQEFCSWFHRHFVLDKRGGGETISDQFKGGERGGDVFLTEWRGGGWTWNGLGSSNVRSNKTIYFSGETIAVQCVYFFRSFGHKMRENDKLEKG